jgi:hypothetical protein
MTFESHEVDAYIARRAEQSKIEDVKLLLDIMRYAGTGLVVLFLLDAMLRAG